jgi:hypothetical protein
MKKVDTKCVRVLATFAMSILASSSSADAGVELNCLGYGTSTLNGEMQRLPGELEIEMTLDDQAQVGCLLYKKIPGQQINKQKNKCHEAEVTESTFRLLTAETEQIGRSIFYEKCDFYVNRYTGKAHYCATEVQFGGDFRRKFDYYFSCVKIRDFETKKKF